MPVLTSSKQLLESHDVVKRLRRFGWLGGPLGLPLLVAAQVTSVMHDGDFRKGGFPLFVAVAAAGWLVSTAALWLVHEGYRRRLLNIGVAVLALGLCGAALGFVAIWIGDVLDIDEGTGPAGWLVPLALAIGIFAIPIGLFLTGIGTLRAAVLSPLGRWLPLGMVALVPAGMLLSGAVEGMAEAVVGVIWFLSFGIGWTLIGLDLRLTADSATV